MIEPLLLTHPVLLMQLLLDTLLLVKMLLLLVKLKGRLLGQGVLLVLYVLRTGALLTFLHLCINVLLLTRLSMMQMMLQIPH